MRKLKKLAAVLLSAAMVFTTMAVPVLAEGKMPTIDTTKQGSLTIHKYEYNVDETHTVGTVGTGASTDAVPEGASALSGVTFKITKVAELTDYYGADAKELPSLEAAQATAVTVQANAEKEGAAEAQKALVKTGTTGEDGIVKFSDLALGLYLVQETAAPAQITGKVQDFLVSIPMTNSTEDDWLYDVHVFPKNSSTYAGVTLLKQGKAGDADAAALAGATFVLQKKESDIFWSTVTKNNKGADIGEKGVLTTRNDGKITVSDLAPGTYRFVEIGVPKNTGFIMDGTDTRVFEITSEGKVMINGTETDTSQSPITVVNYKPDVEKEVKDREAGSWGDDSDYSVGDTVPYRVKVDVPANVAKLADFTISDTMEHQTYTVGSLKIYSDAALKNEILSDQYSVTTSSNSAWSIAFNSKSEDTITSLVSNYAGQSIYIYFETTLTNDAVTTSDGNDNTVKLEYSNKILPTTNDDGNPNEPGTPGKDVITDQATVYTFKIAVEKVDASNQSTKLQGVEFDLYRKLADNADGSEVLSNPVNGLTGKYEKVNTASLVTDKDGAVSVNGLENGEYYLVETKTNDGYNLLKAPVEVKIAAEYLTETSTTTETDENGVTTTTTTVTNTRFEETGNNGVFTTVIKNNKGFTLPTTGGMGTVIFTIGGIALALAGVMIILASRKKAA